MFVFLSKFLPPLVYPLGLAVILLVGALVFTRKAKLHNALIITAILLLLIGSNRWFAYTLARSLEWQYLPQENIPQADVIVVLGGGTESAQYPRPTVEINSAGDRVLYAAYLYKEGKAPAILVSGGNIVWLGGRTMTPAQEMAEVLMMMGVPEEDIWLQPESQNTQEDAAYSAQMLKEKGAERVLLVTSAMHMPRSVALFRHLGIEVIPAPTDYTVTQSGWENMLSFDPQAFLVNLLPNASSLSLSTNALKEYLGLFVYGLRGWL